MRQLPERELKEWETTYDNNMPRKECKHCLFAYETCSYKSQLNVKCTAFWKFPTSAYFKSRYKLSRISIFNYIKNHLIDAHLYRNKWIFDHKKIPLIKKGFKRSNPTQKGLAEIGITYQTMRNWEQRGLISIPKDATGHRIWPEGIINNLLEIKYALKEIRLQNLKNS